MLLRDNRYNPSSLSPSSPVFIHFLPGFATPRGSQLHSISKNNLCIFEIYLLLRTLYECNTLLVHIHVYARYARVRYVCKYVYTCIIRVENIYAEIGRNSTEGSRACQYIIKIYKFSSTPALFFEGRDTLVAVTAVLLL